MQEYDRGQRYRQCRPAYFYSRNEISPKKQSKPRVSGQVPNLPLRAAVFGILNWIEPVRASPRLLVEVFSDRASTGLLVGSRRTSEFSLPAEHEVRHQSHLNAGRKRGQR